VLATGASAVQPKVPGVELDGSFVLRSAEDAMRLRHWTQTHKAASAIVIGGGVLGIEAADALRQLGIAPLLIARAERLMERQLDDEAGAILRQYLEADGIAVRTSVEVTEILGDGRVTGVTLTDGAQLPCDIVLSCAGIAPNADLARAAGLEVRRGVVVDATMRTSDAAIFAVGDVAELPGTLGGLWPVGKKHGEVAAATILGDAVEYVDTRTMMHVKLGGIDVKCYGDLSLPSCEHLTGSTTVGQTWRRVAIKDGKIVGGVFVAESPIAKLVANALLDDVDVSGIIDRLRSDDWEALAAQRESPKPAKIPTVSGGDVLEPPREPVA
jgi:NAD(P)H-nitrite reductase large subunit